MKIVPIMSGATEATEKFFEELDEVIDCWRTNAPVWRVVEELADVATVSTTCRCIRDGYTNWYVTGGNGYKPDVYITMGGLQDDIRRLAAARLSGLPSDRFDAVYDAAQEARNLALNGIALYGRMTGRHDLLKRALAFVVAKNRLRYYNDGGLRFRRIEKK